MSTDRTTNDPELAEHIEREHIEHQHIERQGIEHQGIERQGRAGGFVRAQPWISTVLRIVLGVVFIAAGALKLPDPGAAVRGVRAYQLVPEAFVPFFAYGLPVIEILLGIALIVGLQVRWSAVLTGLLLVVFIAGISSAWARGLSIDCGCFGKGGEVEPGQTQYLPEILRDLAMIAACAFLVRFPRGRFSVDGWLAGPSAQPRTR